LWWFFLPPSTSATLLTLRHLPRHLRNERSLYLIAGTISFVGHAQLQAIRRDEILVAAAGFFPVSASTNLDAGDLRQAG